MKELRTRNRPEPTRPSRPDFDKEVLPDLLRAIRKQVETLDVSVGIFQDGQALVPLPSDDELAEMRRGKRPLSREAYLIGLFQRAIVAAEDLASDLRTAFEPGTLKNVHVMQLSAVEFNHIAAGLERLRG